MKKIILMALLLSIFVTTKTFAEDVDEVKTAVNKVMERFNKSNPSQESSTLVVTNDKVVEVSVTTEENIVPNAVVPNAVVPENLEIIEPIKTAKFESSDIAYPTSGTVKKAVEKEKPKREEALSQKVIPKKAQTQKNSHSLADIEAKARKIIEEETQKVEKAKKSALEKINRAMKRVDEAKKQEAQEKEAEGAF